MLASPESLAETLKYRQDRENGIKYFEDMPPPFWYGPSILRLCMPPSAHFPPPVFLGAPTPKDVCSMSSTLLLERLKAH